MLFRSRDSIDRALLDICTGYRDVLTLQLGAATNQDLINEHLREILENRASSSTQAEILKRWEEVMGTRKSLKFNVAPLLALEVLFLKVRF